MPSKKLLPLLILFFTVFTAIGQDSSDVYSLFFDSKSGATLTALKGFDSGVFGTFTLKETKQNGMRVAAGNELGIDASGMYIQKNTILSISRETIRENSNFTIRNGYLFGVLPNDSVLVALDGELYYYLLPTKTYLFETYNKAQQLYKGANASEFVIVAKESDTYYSVLYVIINQGSVILKEIGLNNNKSKLTNLTHKKVVVDGIPTYILSPTSAEWQTVWSCLTPYDTYIKK